MFSKYIINIPPISSGAKKKAPWKCDKDSQKRNDDKGEEGKGSSTEADRIQKGEASPERKWRRHTSGQKETICT